MELEKSSYRVLAELYHSLHSTIYRVFSLKEQKTVVLKVLNPDHINAESIIKFQQEYAVHKEIARVSKLVVQPYELIRTQDSMAIVMEDIAGISLEKWLNQTIEWNQFHSIALNALAVMKEIHDCGVIHLDFHPMNMLIDETSNRIRLIDFGHASYSSVVKQGLSLTPNRFRTLAYQSPEQTGWSSKDCVDYRSDYYSYGIILYQMATGQVPHNADCWRDGILFKLKKLINHSQITDEGIPGQLWQVINRLCELYPEDRYQSIEEIQADLQQCFSLAEHNQQIDQKNRSLSQIEKNHLSSSHFIESDHQIDSLKQDWHYFAQGSLCSINIHGAKKAGKSLLTRELIKFVLEVNGIWISLECDKSFRAGPLRLVRSLLMQLIEYYRNHSPSKSDLIIKEINSKLEPNLPVLIDLLPELGQFLGYQDLRETQGPLQWESSHLYDSLERLLELLAANDGPIVICCDDAQWADIPSLKFLAHLIHQRNIPQILVVTVWECGHSGKDFDPMAVKYQFAAHHSYAKTIVLSKEAPIDLSGDIDHIQSLMVQTDQNLELSISEEDKEILFYAAILGKVWSVMDWQFILPADLLRKIEDRVGHYLSRGIILPVENYGQKCLFHFDISAAQNLSHSSYHMLMFASHSLHQEILKWGQKLYQKQNISRFFQAIVRANDPASREEDGLFFLAEAIYNLELNDLPKNHWSDFAEILSEAGKRSFYYQDFSKTCDFLGKVWEIYRKYGVGSDVDKEALIAARLMISLIHTEQEEAADGIFQLLLSWRLSSETLSYIYYLKMRVFEFLSRFEKAVQAGLQAQMLMQEVSFPRKNRFSKIIEKPLSTYQLARQIRVLGKILKITSAEESHHVINTNDDLNFQIRCRILALFWRHGHRVNWQVMLGRQLTGEKNYHRLHRGNDIEAFFAVSLAAWSKKMGRRDTNAELLGHRAYETVILDTRSPFSSYILNLYGSYIMHWERSWRELSVLFDSSISLAFAVDDKESLAESIHQRLVWSTNESCQQIIQRSAELFRCFGDKQHQELLIPSFLVAQKYKSFYGQTKSLCQLNDDEFDEEVFLCNPTTSQINLTIFCLHKAELLYFAQQTEAAFIYLKRAAKGIHLLHGQVYQLTFAFFRGLIVADLLRLQRLEKRIALNILRIVLGHFRRWSKQNEFHLSMYYLLKAEFECLQLDKQADETYEDALAVAKGKHSPMLVALIYERFSISLLNRGKNRLAKIFFQDSLEYYELAGAYSKIRLLREELALKGLIDLPMVQLNSNDRLLQARIKPSGWTKLQSSEKKLTELHHLIENLGKVAIHDRPEQMVRHLLEQVMLSSGSEKTLLIQKYANSDQYWVDSCIIGHDLAEHSSGQIADYGEQFSRKVLDYVKQTGKSLNFNKTVKEAVLCNDPYIITFDVQAIMCVPYSFDDGNWAALYLEKTVMDEPFSLELIETTKVLISILRLVQLQSLRVLGHVAPEKEVVLEFVTKQVKTA